MTKSPEYAFWHYDIVPWFLGAAIKSINPDGSVITSYGRIAPAFVVPLEEGLKIQEQLNAVKSEHRKLSSEIHANSKKRVKEIIEEAKKLADPSSSINTIKAKICEHYHWDVTIDDNEYRDLIQREMLELAGWKRFESSNLYTKGDSKAYWPFPAAPGLPNYTSNLNAIRELELKIVKDPFKYMRTLQEVQEKSNSPGASISAFNLLTCSALSRCEALLLYSIASECTQVATR